MPSTLFPLLILYGSQTGNAEAIAKELHAELSTLLPHSPLHLSSMSDFIKADDSLSTLPSYPLLLFVLSTTGQGDPPDNAGKFLRILRRRLPPSPPFLPSSSFAVLALGDTNYTNFCKPGQRLDLELSKMGGERWIPLAMADDGTNLQEVVEPWKVTVISRLTPTTSAPQPPPPSSTTPSVTVTPLLSVKVAAPAKGSGLYTPSSTASAIQQAQQAMRALHLARTSASPRDNISMVQSPSHSPLPLTPSPPTSSPPPSLLPLPPSLILFATQTGNSEAIARELHALFTSHFTPPATLLSTSQFLSVHHSSILPLASFPLIFVVISSTGQGAPPDNALRFLRLLHQQGEKEGGVEGGRKWLEGVRYAVLGLGDKNYDTFGAASERMERELVLGGAQRLMVREVADDAAGLALVVEPWKKKWIDRLTQVATEMQVGEQAAPKVQVEAANGQGDKEEERKDRPAFVHLVPVTEETKAAEVKERGEEEDASLKKPKVRVAKPVGLARFHPIRVSVQTNPPRSSSSSSSSSSSPASLSDVSSSYFSRRWQGVDTEAVLKGYTPDAPFFVTLSSARYLTTAKAHEQGRRVVHLELEMSGVSKEAVLYTPGDSIGCFCVNDVHTVQRLAERLDLRLDDVVDVKLKEAGETEAVEKELVEPPVMHAATPSPTSRALSTSPLPLPPLSAAPTAATGLSHILSPCTVSDVLLYCVDVASPPKKTFLRMLAEFCHAEEDKAKLYHLASHGGKRSYDALISSTVHSVLDLLAAFPSCKPPLAYLLDHLPALQPRYYSITSSPSVHPTSIHVAYTLVPGGVCTSWLMQLCQASGFLREDGFAVREGQPLLGVQAQSLQGRGTFCLPIFMRRTHTFTLPQSLSTPLIFVGPGTGVAPFRSFLFHRRCQLLALASGGVAMGTWRGLDLDMEEVDEEEEPPTIPSGYVDRFARTPRSVSHPALHSSPSIPSLRSASSSASSPSTATSTEVGSVLLFFGCRAPDQDFLYREEFLSFLADKTLSTMVTAYSRVGEGKVYVQDRMREEGRVVWEMLERGAMLFVCGDGGGMAKGVMRAVQDVYVQHEGLSETEALERVAQLMRDKKYVQDVWS